MAGALSSLALSLRRTTLAAVILALLLSGLGLVVFPGALAEWQGELPGLAGVAVVLGLYAILAWWGSAPWPRWARR